MKHTIVNASGETVALQRFNCGHDGNAFFAPYQGDRPCGDCRNDRRRMAGEGGHPDVSID